MATLTKGEGNLYIFNPDGNTPPRRLPRNSSLQIAEKLFGQALDAEEAGKTDAALDFYLEAIKVNPNGAGTLVNIGLIYYRKRQYKQAEEYFRKAIEVDPRYPLAIFNLGNLCEETGKFDQAELYYLSALEISPRYADAHFNIGLLYSRRGECVKAIKHLRAFRKHGAGIGQMYLEIATREIKMLREELGKSLEVVSMPAQPETGPVSTSLPDVS